MEMEVKLHTFLTSALDGGKDVTFMFKPLCPWQNSSPDRKRLRDITFNNMNTHT